MVKISKDELLNWLEREEYIDLSWDYKLLRRTSLIKTTADVACDSDKWYAFSEESIFRPSVLTRNVLTLSAILIFSIVSYALVISVKFSFVRILLFLLVVISFSYWLIKEMRKEFSFEIKINEQGVFVKNINFQWHNILETYIVERPQGRYKAVFLILGEYSGVLNRFRIYNISNHNKLAKAIEYYKKLYESKQLPLSPVSTSGNQCSP